VFFLKQLNHYELHVQQQVLINKIIIKKKKKKKKPPDSNPNPDNKVFASITFSTAVESVLFSTASFAFKPSEKRISRHVVAKANPVTPHTPPAMVFFLAEKHILAS
jgi:hypothetical protein